MTYDYDVSKTVGFTGFRAEKFDFTLRAGVPEYERFKQVLRDEIENAIVSGFVYFLNGAATGMDLISGLVVYNLKKEYPDLKLITAIPFRNSDYNFSADWKKLYKSIIQKSDKVYILANRPYSGVFYDRNRFLVDNSSLLICYYIKKEGVCGGGTKWTLGYNSNNKANKVVNIAELM